VESLLQDDDVHSGRTTNSIAGLKRSITFDPIVGSRLNFFRSFRRLFSLE
jgi:hypothetical protein